MSVVLKKLSVAQCTPEALAQIIKEKQLANDLNYKALIYLLRCSGSKEDKTDLLKIIQNLTVIVALFDRNCEDIFTEIITVVWELEPRQYREVIKQYLIAIISSQPFYTNKVIDRIIRNLVVCGSDEEVLIHQTNVEILKFITDNMPAHIKHIQHKLKTSFPHKSRSLQEHQSYIANILKLSEVIPLYFTDVVFTIVEKFVKIDVDISKSDESGTDELFSFDEERSAEQQEDEVCHKLDVLLTQFLSYMRGDLVREDEIVSQWCKVMLISFDSHILRAHIPPNVPFIIFVFFNLRPSIKTVLLDYFWSVFVDVNKPAIIRQSGVMYLTSFVNRAKCVKTGDFKKVMLTVSYWCHSYIENNDEISAKCNHTAFYAACQSLFYMFCYRHQDITNSAEQKLLLDKLNFHSIIHCKLNPLRHCSTPILRMFNKLTSLYEVVMCNMIIERNARMLLPSSQRFGNEEYPFKSCTLKSLSHVIGPYFRNMECGTELVSECRTYKVSENFEDWDNMMVAMSPDFHSMSVS